MPVIRVSKLLADREFPGHSFQVDGDYVVIPRGFAQRTNGQTQRPTSLQHAEGVSFLDKVKNFTKAAVDHVAAGLPTCTDEEIERRYAICQGCEFFVNNSCGKCGCPISRDKKFVSKIAWADQKCPVGKWDSNT
jgi:hypothetical protein